MKLDPYFTPFTKINLKLVKDLYVKPKTVKLQKKTTNKLLDIGLSSKNKGNKTKNKQVILYQTESFYTANNAMKR